jgi:6-pyruvoyltetrahydropterin/6-carboxytetrahydropterin synthase
MEFEIKQHFRIESARFLPKLPSSHPCSQMHGHSFRITLRLVGPLNPEVGWMIDFNDIKEKASPLLSSLDHKVLNQVPGLENPTSEILAQFVYTELKKELPGLRQVSISETPDTACSFPAL